MEPKIKQLITDYIKQRKPDVVGSVLENALFDAEHEVLDYCHVAEIDEHMAYITSKIILDLIERDEVKLVQGLDADQKGLKSIKQGDTSLEFDSVLIESNSQIIIKYHRELSKFRKMVF